MVATQQQIEGWLIAVTTMLPYPHGTYPHDTANWQARLDLVNCSELDRV